MTDWLLVGAHIHRYRGIGDVQVPIGGVTVLIGPNGSGKSSMLEALGYLTPEEGAFARRNDPPSEVSWYLRPTDRSPHQQSLQHAFERALRKEEAEAEHAARIAIVDMCKRSLCVRRGPNGRQQVALDMFGLFIDQLAPKRRARERQLQGRLAELTPGRVSERIERAILRGPDAMPTFIDLGIAWNETALAVPNRVSMAAVADDVSPHLLGLVRVLIRHAFGRIADDNQRVRAAIDAMDTGLLAPALAAGLVGPVVRVLDDEVRECLPAFVKEAGVLSISLRQGPDAVAGEVRAMLRELALLSLDNPLIFERCLSAFDQLGKYGDSIDHHFECAVLDRRSRQVYPYSRLGTGTRRWIFGAIDEAGRRLARMWAVEPLTAEEYELVEGAQRLPPREPAKSATSLRLIDEPLENIEGRRHGEVISWLTSQRDVAGERLLVSSHQASALRAGTADSLVVVGLRREQGIVRSRAFGPGLLASLDRHFRELGISREELLFGARALLMVEGSDDLAVLSALYGDKLSEYGVFVHTLGGHTARSITDAFRRSPYRLLELPAWAMLDSTRDPLVPADLMCDHSKSASVPSPLKSASLPKSVPLTPLMFEPHDIGAGLHRDVYAAVPGSRVPSKEEFMRALRKCQTGVETKALISKWVKPGTDLKRISFSRDVLLPALELSERRQRGSADASPWLQLTMSAFFDQLDRPVVS